MSSAFPIAFFMFLLVGTALCYLIPDRDVPEATPESGETDERLATTEDILAIRAEFDRMLVGKGLVTDGQLELIRHGTKSRAVVTGMRTTGHTREDFREVELDVIVKRPEGGQFPAHERALIPASAIMKVSPGSIIETYYRSGDESAVAVCVSPR
ncbi:hypothetical protein BST36_14070 [Mycolicibacterium moriokaense]|jgi:hypothetical protein|uniref:Uncharacterized protein n=1 Tax=Mycolicibacterium moriokaense TaxID=39691 RepID=A0AAD1HBW7_9MYCO|nr:hypothetical protein [Mycolicibacterium moriokaense]MCV7038680.1 hypothetical protein [Mycolicibacterium moriokaense]ORB22540.1 hypothetical protein BST36_14070 [Mycolicibacterium moriokaense]BBX02204.1 hypothetical protein MMOR_31400 [Mycolicibacterium moriokaense]